MKEKKNTIEELDPDCMMHCALCSLPSGVACGDRPLSSRLKNRFNALVTVLTRGILPAMLCMLLVEPKRLRDGRRPPAKKCIPLTASSPCSFEIECKWKFISIRSVVFGWKFAIINNKQPHETNMHI